MENRMTNSNLKFVASDEIRQDNIRAMSNVFSEKSPAGCWAFFYPESEQLFGFLPVQVCHMI
jgi:hypothetical protein